MTRRREINRHLHSLGEIREIMGAMRNLALLETRKLARAVAAQDRVVDTMRGAATELLAWFPDLARDAGEADRVLILLGSERGFCGDFNRSLLATLEEVRAGSEMPVVVVGQRLASRMPASVRPIASLAGPTTTEEVPEVLVRLVSTLQEWHGDRDPGRPLRPSLIHQSRAAGVVTTSLHPALGGESGRAATGYPPRVNLPPQELFVQLTEHYLYGVLCQVFYGSLMAENERRMRHMENALTRIDEQSDELRRRSNGLRQEEITEEIEVITMSSALREDESTDAGW